MAAQIKVDDFVMPLVYSYQTIDAADIAELEDAFEDLAALAEDELTSSREQAVEILDKLLGKYDIQRSGVQVKVTRK